MVGFFTSIVVLGSLIMFIGGGVLNKAILIPLQFAYNDPNRVSRANDNKHFIEAYEKAKGIK